MPGHSKPVLCLYLCLTPFYTEQNFIHINYISGTRVDDTLMR